MFKTHMVIALFVALFFLGEVTHKLSFIPLVLFASALPDIDSAFSTLGKHRVAKLVQLFTRHRGLLHSFTFLIAVTVLLTLYVPVIALPFFLGYALHLLLDAVTIEGIKPFWPLQSVSRGKLPVGGAVEEALFMGFIVVDLAFIVSFFI